MRHCTAVLLFAALTGYCFGFRPLPPPRCYVACVCDHYGQNCRYEVICR